MTPSSFWEPVRFGATGRTVSRLAIGSSYGIDTESLERAFERGVRFFFWGAIRRPAFGRAIRNLAPRHRDEMTIAIQSYTRVGFLMAPFVHSALRRLKIDRVDILTLSWWQDVPPERILDAALKLKEQGKVGHLMISSHHRPAFEHMLKNPAYDALMVRYNAAHTGAEHEVFPHVRDAGVLAFTATRWGSLLDPKLTPKGERTPRGADCYRFVLSDPRVHVSLCGPKNAQELDEAMRALDLGLMSADELAWMRRVGKSVRGDAKANRPIQIADRLVVPQARDGLS